MAFKFCRKGFGKKLWVAHARTPGGQDRYSVCGSRKEALAAGERATAKGHALVGVTSRYDFTLKTWGVPIDAVLAAAESQPSAKPRRADQPVVIIEDESVRRQVRRVLESMREFTFDRGGHWQSWDGGELKSGYTPRVGGDPIFNTITELARVEATRAQVEEAIAAVAEGRSAKLPPRMATLPEAVKRVAEALKDGRRIVRDEDGLSVRIEGPMLPPDWDQSNTLDVDCDDN